jgi:hypothetical protein
MFGFAACGPVLNRPPVSPDLVKEEAELQRDLAERARYNVKHT